MFDRLTDHEGIDPDDDDGGRVARLATATGLEGLALLERVRQELAEEFLAESGDDEPAVSSPPDTYPHRVDGDLLLDITREAATRWDPATATDDQLLAVATTIESARRHLDAAALHALAELDVRGVTDAQEGLVTGSWLANEAQLPTGTSKARVKLALKLRVSLPEVDQALSAGRISVEHARALADAANPRILDDFALLVGNLIDAAGRLGFDRWKREVTALADLLDADGGHRPGDDITDNTLRIRRGLDDVLHADGQFTADLALTVEGALNAKADELFHRYRNDQELTPDLRMPPRTTLLALAMAELLREALAKDPASSTPARPDASLIVNAADPDVVTTGEGVRIGDTERDTLLCDPVFRAVVMGLHGVVVDMGREQRLVNPRQRRAMNHRDGGCIFPGCDRPANWTDAHHVWHWLRGGPTDLSLLASLCRHHHGVSHRTGWNMYVTDDEWFWWCAPSGHTFWSQRHGHQRHGPTPDPTTCTTASGPGTSCAPRTDPQGHHDGTDPPDTR